MPTTITSNPTRFGASTPAAGSVRQAFNAEGYGISTSLFAYRQGGGIVPATSAFNAIGAGTAGDPLRLSQFSNFSVPGTSLDVQSVTVGQYNLGGTYGTYWGFYSGLTGSCSDGTSNIYGDAVIGGLYYHTIGYGIINFRVNSTVSNSGWTGMNIAGTEYLRTDASFTASGGQSLWQWSGTIDSGIIENPFGTTVGAVKSVFWT